MRGGTFQDIKLCGINSGQHCKLSGYFCIVIFPLNLSIKYWPIFTIFQIFSVYYDVENVNGPITVTILLTQANTPRLWEIKVKLIFQFDFASYYQR